MGYLFYNLLLLIASPFIFLVLLVKPRCRRGLWQRLGQVPNSLRDVDGPLIWVHAVSLGEVTAVVPLVRGLRRQLPHYTFVISTVTETGREAVEKQLVGVARHCYCPLDFPWAVRAYVKAMSPAAFLFIETELWPNLLRAMFRRQIPTILVNGRLSTESFGRYRRIKGFMQQVLSCMTMCLMQSERDAQRMIVLGSNPKTVHVTGNMKFDLVSEEITSSSALSRESLGLQESDRLFIAGSTHSDEEDQLLRCYRRLCDVVPSLTLLIAPRHIERIEKVEEKVLGYGFPCQRKSQLNGRANETPFTRSPRVVLLDTRGDLASLYALGWIAFVGGTLTPVGGHNLLEPAYWGVPVLFGPYTDHCEEVANILREAGGGIEVKDEEELCVQVTKAYRDPNWRSRVGQAAQQAVLEHRGVVQENLALIQNVVHDDSSASVATPATTSPLRSSVSA